MSVTEQAETRFVGLMTELFQLDEAESLDFGIYRVIKRHNLEVRDFLGEIVVENEQKSLKGGLLAELLEKAFSSADAETTADDKYRLIQLEKELSLKAGMSPAEREAQLVTLEKVSATANMVAEYRSRKEQMASAATASSDRTEVLNRLYQFFARHYQDGDFIVERRYGRDGSRYIRSTGEDTEFHWATEDMYYIKSGDVFTDFPVKLSRGQRLLFTVETTRKSKAESKASASAKTTENLKLAKQLRAAAKAPQKKKTAAAPPFPSPLTGDAIYSWRSSIGQTQAQFAAKVGVAAPSVCQWEKKGEQVIGMQSRTLARLIRGWKLTH